MRFLVLLVLSAIIVSCGTAVGVDYDQQTDFSQYTTYNYYPNLESGLSELDNTRIIKSTDSILQLRGFVLSEDPQLYINFFATEFLSNSNSSIGIGVGGGGGNVSGGVSGGIPIGGKVINQRLTVDFIDVEKDNLIWQAIADGDFKEKASPKKMSSYYYSVMSKILKKYPPKKNKEEKN